MAGERLSWVGFSGVIRGRQVNGHLSVRNRDRACKDTTLACADSK